MPVKETDSKTQLYIIQTLIQTVTLTQEIVKNFQSGQSRQNCDIVKSIVLP